MIEIKGKGKASGYAVEFKIVKRNKIKLKSAYTKINVQSDFLFC